MNMRIKPQEPKMQPLKSLTDTGRKLFAKKLEDALSKEGKLDAERCGITQDPVIIRGTDKKGEGVVAPGMAAIAKVYNKVAYVHFYDYENIKAYFNKQSQQSLKGVARGKARHPELPDVQFGFQDIILLRDYLPGDKGLPGQRPVVKINPPSDQGSDIEDWMNGINY